MVASRLVFPALALLLSRSVRAISLNTTEIADTMSLLGTGYPSGACDSDCLGFASDTLSCTNASLAALGTDSPTTPAEADASDQVAATCYCVASFYSEVKTCGDCVISVNKSTPIAIEFPNYAQVLGKECNTTIHLSGGVRKLAVGGVGLVALVGALALLF